LVVAGSVILAITQDPFHHCLVGIDDPGYNGEEAI
jgi:hypothetical protein